MRNCEGLPYYLLKLPPIKTARLRYLWDCKFGIYKIWLFNWKFFFSFPRLNLVGILNLVDWKYSALIFLSTFLSVCLCYSPERYTFKSVLLKVNTRALSQYLAPLSGKPKNLVFLFLLMSLSWWTCCAMSSF